MYLICSTAALFLGFLLDLILGDPHGMWHPVISIGHLIEKTEQSLRKVFPKTQRGELVGGSCLVLVVAAVSTAVPLALVVLCYRLHWSLGLVLETVMCYFILATKALKTESMRVAQALEQEGLAAGRRAVSMIVGRDTESLSEAGVIKAAVETVAENTSDGIIAPMLYMAIGGPVLGFFYKSINTMDSMVGYKNEAYLYFGRAAAKLDDVVNFIPARLSAWLMIGAAGLLSLGNTAAGKHTEAASKGFSGKEAFRIYRRDCRKHASPNSAQTEAVMAGALKVQLAGDAWYFGEKHEKPTIGDDIRPVEISDIRRANQLLYGAAWLGMLVCLAVRAVIL